MTVVLDTSIIIDVLRGVDAAREYYRGLETVPTCSEITRVEVLIGMRSPERGRTKALLAALDWASVDSRVSQRAGVFGRTYRASHRGLGVADLLIAATAHERGAELVTTNARHFPMLEAVTVPY